jgi:hypothetical protein
MIIGYYNHYGYRIESNGQELYCGGNNPLESTAVNDPLDPAALPLTIIRKYCRHTAREMAEERQEPFGGIEREEEYASI